MKHMIGTGCVSKDSSSNFSLNSFRDSNIRTVVSYALQTKAGFFH